MGVEGRGGGIGSREKGRRRRRRENREEEGVY